MVGPVTSGRGALAARPRDVGSWVVNAFGGGKSAVTTPLCTLTRAERDSVVGYRITGALGLSTAEVVWTLRSGCIA